MISTRVYLAIIGLFLVHLIATPKSSAFGAPLSVGHREDVVLVEKRAEVLGSIKRWLHMEPASFSDGDSEIRHSSTNTFTEEDGLPEGEERVEYRRPYGRPYGGPYGAGVGAGVGAHVGLGASLGAHAGVGAGVGGPGSVFLRDVTDSIGKKVDSISRRFTNVKRVVSAGLQDLAANAL